METIDSPLGRLEVNEADDGSRFASGTYRGPESGIFFSIQLTADSSLMADARFAMSRMDDVERYSRRASEYLATATHAAATASGEERLVWNGEFIFFGGGDWAILFADGALDICEPLGVLVNFSDDEVTGYEDLSSAEEM